MKRHIAYIPGEGYEWLEDPRHVQSILDSRGKRGAKPQGSPASRDTGKYDRDVLDELSSQDVTAYRSDTGKVLYIANGRFDLQFTAKLLGEQMSTPTRLGELRLERCARYLAGQGHLCLWFPFQKKPTGSEIFVDSNWAEPPDRCSTHAGCEFHGQHLVDSWVATDQVRALSSAEAELYGIVDGAARGLHTRSMHEESLGEEWQVHLRCDSSAAIAISTRAGVGRTRHIETRWLWIQDATRERRVVISKVPTATNVADIGTKALDPKQHGQLMKLLPLRTPVSPHLLAAIAAASATVAEGKEAEENDANASGSSAVLITLAIMIFTAGVVFPSVLNAVICALAAARRMTRAEVNDKATQTDGMKTSSVSSQSPVTYAALRGNVKPRFQVLAENIHG